MRLPRRAFRSDGALVGVPYESGYGPDFPKEDFGLHRVPRVAAYRGFVFGSLAPQGASLDEHLGEPVKRQIDLFCDLSPTGRTHLRSGTHRYGYDANWKLQVENSIDGYHTNFTHQAFPGLTQRRTGLSIDLFEGGPLGLNRDLGNGHTLLDRRAYSRSDPGTARRVAMVKQLARPYWEALVQRHGEARADETNTLRLRMHEQFYGPAGGGNPDDL